MENNNFENRVIYHRAKAELMSRLKIMGTIAAFWFLLFRVLTLWTDGVTNLDLIRDSVTAATALYLPFRVGYRLSGTPTGGAVGAVLILLWVSTWIGDHELLVRLLIVGGYVIDFGPCIYRILVSRSR